MEIEKHERRRAIVMLLAAAVLWSIGGMLIKLVEWNPLAIAGMRSAISALVFLVFLRKPKITWSAVQIGGAIAYAGTVIFFVIANKTTTAANAILLQYTSPVYIALFSAWLLGERVTWLDWLTIALVLIGMTLFLYDSLGTGRLLGDSMALISAVCFASLVMLLRKQKDSSPFESVLLGNLLTAIIGLPFMFQSMPSAKSWLGLILLGVFQLGFSYVLYTKAIQHVTALEATLISFIEPLLNPLWVALTRGEIPSVLAMIGGLIVLGAVAARSVLSNLNKNAQASA
ncbi:MAG TPA: DMT family transporter [Blastocatellia bacterium]|nr:DMT family transporter [Blastocatellia bacterium]